MLKLYRVKAQYHFKYRAYGADQTMSTESLMIVLAADVREAEEMVRTYLFKQNDPEETRNMRFDLLDTSEITTGTAHWMIDGFIIGGTVAES